MRRLLFFTLIPLSFAAAFSLSAPKPPGMSQSQTAQISDEPQSDAQSPEAKNYLGFDLNTYPGDAALPILRKSFSFAGYWLSVPPGAKQNTWIGKRELMRSQGFGFALLYTGPLGKQLKSATRAKARGLSDARRAVLAAKREGFPRHMVIFLDIEEGGRLSPSYHAYLRAWADELMGDGYRAGVYCSGMPVSEGHGVTIVTADDIRDNLGGREMEYWVFNDACPPAPGCGVPSSPPPPATSGVAYAAIWQFAQSPRRKEFTDHCAATYSPDGNCYAPGDSARAWFLDVNSASSADPSESEKGRP